MGSQHGQKVGRGLAAFGVAGGVAVAQRDVKLEAQPGQQAATLVGELRGLEGELGVHRRSRRRDGAAAQEGAAYKATWQQWRATMRAGTPIRTWNESDSTPASFKTCRWRGSSASTTS